MAETNGNAGRSAEDSRGSGLLRLAPIPGLDGPPSGGPRDGLIARISSFPFDLELDVDPEM